MEQIRSARHFLHGSLRSRTGGTNSLMQFPAGTSILNVISALERLTTVLACPCLAVFSYSSVNDVVVGALDEVTTII